MTDYAPCTDTPASLPRTLIKRVPCVKALFVALIAAVCAIALFLGSIPTQAFAADQKESNFNVALVIDGSGSLSSELMGQQATDPDNVRYDALSLFLALLTNSGNNVDAIVFNDSPQFLLNTGLQPIEGRDAKVQLIDQIRAAGATGDTDMGTALLEAVNTLQAAEEQNGLPSVVVLFSDGRTDLGDDEAAYQQSLANKQTAVDEASQAGIPIYSICLQATDVANPAELQEISQATGGDFIVVNSASDLTSAFESFYSLIFPSSSTEATDEVLDANGQLNYSFTVPTYGVREVNIIMDDTNVTSVALSSSSRTLSSEEIDASTITGGKYRVIKLVDPEIGLWNLQVTGTPSSTVTINVIYNVDTEVALTSDTESTRLELGTPVTFTASLLQDGVQIVDDVVTTEYTSVLWATNEATGETTQVAMDPQTGGVFTGTFTPETDGVYQMSAVMSGGGVDIASAQSEFTFVTTAATLSSTNDETQFETSDTASLTAQLTQSGEVAPAEVSAAWSATLHMRNAQTDVESTMDMVASDDSTYTCDVNTDEAGTYEVYAELTDGTQTVTTDSLELTFESTLARIETTSGQTEFEVGTNPEFSVTVTRDGSPLSDAEASAFTAKAHVTNATTGKESTVSMDYDKDGTYTFTLEGRDPVQYSVWAELTSDDLDVSSPSIDVAVLNVELSLSVDGDATELELGTPARLSAKLEVNGEMLSDESAVGFAPTIYCTNTASGEVSEMDMTYVGEGTYEVGINPDEPLDLEAYAECADGQITVDSDTLALSFVRTQVSVGTDTQATTYNVGEPITIEAAITRNGDTVSGDDMKSYAGTLYAVNDATGEETTYDLEAQDDGTWSCELEAPEAAATLNVHAAFDKDGTSYTSSVIQIGIEALTARIQSDVADLSNLTVGDEGVSLNVQLLRNDELVGGDELNGYTATLHITNDTTGESTDTDLELNSAHTGWEYQLSSSDSATFEVQATLTDGDTSIESNTVSASFVDAPPTVVGSDVVDVKKTIMPLGSTVMQIDLGEHFTDEIDGNNLSYAIESSESDGSNATDRAQISGSTLSVEMAPISACTVVVSATDSHGSSAHATFQVSAFDTRPIFAIVLIVVVLAIAVLLFVRHHKATHIHFQGMVSARGLDERASAASGKIVTGKLALSAFGLSRACGFDLSKSFVRATGPRSVEFVTNGEFYTRSGKHKGQVILQNGDNAIYTDESRKSGIIINVSAGTGHVPTPHAPGGVGGSSSMPSARPTGPAVRRGPATRR